MSGIFSKRELQVIGLSDRDEIVETLRIALDGADGTDRPGLARALALVEAAPARTDVELRGRWARERIEAAGVEVKPDSVVAVRALRKAEPALSLIAAVQLTKDAAATPLR
ncbi:hypothetical protein ACH4SP_23310 [Streptomyces sp. NPDC021093]|uniref:hypothetical protein n=1 Tax=Streptomyces sp. NPDC021093 TaxID=3365112 RepID=UPI00379E1820